MSQHNHDSEIPKAPEDLPKVVLSHYGIRGKYLAALNQGVDEVALDEALAAIISALWGKGMTPARIASAIWHSKGLGPRTQMSKFAFLRDTIIRVLHENQIHMAARERELFEEWIYVERQSGYWNRRENKLLDIENFKLRSLSTFGTERETNAHIFFHKKRNDHPNAVVDDLTFWPGASPIVRWNEAMCINRWTPPEIVFGDGAITLWLQLAERLVPDKRFREHMFDWFAWNIQNPDKKPGHHFLIGGISGAGKDSLLEPVLYGMGGGVPADGSEIPVGRKYVKQLKNNELESGFHYFLNNKVLVLQELRAAYAGDRRQLGNELKNLLAAPPHSLTVNEKYGIPFEVPNLHVVLASTNYPDPLPLGRDERRWFAIWSNARKMTPEESKSIWTWYWNDGVTHVAGWLRRRDVSAFNAHAPAPQTPWFHTLVASGNTPVEEALQRRIASCRSPFDTALVNPQGAADVINTWDCTQRSLVGLEKTVTSSQVAIALTAAGWGDLGQCEVTFNKVRNRATLFARPDVAELWTKMSTTFAAKRYFRCARLMAGMKDEVAKEDGEAEKLGLEVPAEPDAMVREMIQHAETDSMNVRGGGPAKKARQKLSIVK